MGYSIKYLSVFLLIFLLSLLLTSCKSDGGLTVGPIEGATGDETVEKETEAAPKSDNVMVNGADFENILKEKCDKSKLTKVSFENTTSGAPSDAFDLSEKADGSVKGWITDNCLYIAGDGGVAANQNSSSLFSGFKNVAGFNFNNSFDTSRVQSFFCVFASCDSLTSLDLSSFDFSSATDMGHMFYGSSIGKLTFGRVDASKVMSMGSMFQEFETENGISFESFKTGSLKSIDLMFCSSNLKNVDLSPFEGNQILELSYIFAGCDELEKVNFGKLDTSKVFDTSCMFENCKSLKELDLSSQNFSSACVMHDMFAGCTSLGRLELNGFKTGELHDVLNLFKDCSSLEIVDVSLMNTSKLFYMTNIFQGCSSLKSVDISMWNTGNAEDFSYMFYGCRSLESVKLGSIDISKVTKYIGMFYGCKTITEIDLTGLDLKGGNFENAFTGCEKLISLGKDFKFPTGCRLWKAFIGCPLNSIYGDQ